MEQSYIAQKTGVSLKEFHRHKYKSSLWQKITFVRIIEGGSKQKIVILRVAKSNKIKTVKKAKKRMNPSASDKQEDASLLQSLAPLMPELEELVKKNPNRLLGCGG
jgi:hypothetical protein